MSTDRSHRLSPSELALKLACRDAVKAAGGQEFVALESGRCQSRISDYCSPNTRDFMGADLVARIEALSAGAPGHPHVTRALARAQGGQFVPGMLAVGMGARGIAEVLLGHWLAEIADDSSDVIGLLAGGDLAAPIARLSRERRQALAREVCELAERLGNLECALTDSS